MCTDPRREAGQRQPWPRIGGARVLQVAVGQVTGPQAAFGLVWQEVTKGKTVITPRFPT